MSFRTTSITLAAASIAVAAAAVGCGSASTTSSGGSKGVIYIASAFPLQGGDAAAGIPQLNGVNFAISTAGTVDGFTIKGLSFDDTVNGVANVQKSVQNVQQMIDNSKVLGMVGPYYSTFGAADIPVANRAGLAMISPTNTDECLTVPYTSCDPQPTSLRPTGTNNYFRITTSDLFQGPAMADYAYNTLGLKKVAAFSDGETSPESMKNHFVTEFEKDGGTIVVNQDYDPTTITDFLPLVLRAKNASADGVYMGGESGTKSCQFRAQMQGVLDVPFLGDDGMTNQQCITEAGTNADGMTNTVPLADPSENPNAAPIIAAYKAAYPNPDQLASYTFPAYDCTKILIAAIGRAIKDNGGNMPTRAQVVKEMAATKDFVGTTGTYTFNKYGDVTGPYMALYHTTGTPAAFTFIKQFAVDPNSVPLNGD
jgi:branched-chain amino acid transport system substrate-binding protein